jgi:hypothetical protein
MSGEIIAIGIVISGLSFVFGLFAGLRTGEDTQDGRPFHSE